MLEEINTVRQTVELWQSQEGPTVLWNGRVTEAISEAVVQSVHDLADSLLCTDFACQQWHTVLAADEFVSQFQAWEKDAELPVPSMHPAGGGQLWNAYQSMIAAMNPRIFHRLEPIESLVKIGCTYKQIADMAGWRDEFGSEDLRKVKEEIDKPGTHYNPKTWVSPEDRRREAELAQAWKTRCERVQKLIDQRDAVEEAVAYEDGPESLEDLVLLPGITVNQILMIKPSATVDQVEETAKRMGVRLATSLESPKGKPASKIAREAEKARQVAAEQDQAERILKADAHRQEEDLTLRLLALRDDGYRPGEIAEILKREGMEISPQKIGRLLAAEADAKA